MKRMLWLLLLLIVCTYTAITWDYHLSKYLFEKYCNDGRLGSVVYEKVELGDEYILPLSERDIDDRRMDTRFITSDGRAIDRAKFDQDYTLSLYRSEPISSIGPIFAIETTVTRNTDNKVLGKAVSLANGLGWWISSSGFGNRSDTCPSGRDDEHVPNYYKAHDDLIRKIFKLRLSLDSDSIPIGEKLVKLSPGMAVTAEIKTGKRRLIEFFLSPLLRYKQESVRER
jgi:hypothetical protein